MQYYPFYFAGALLFYHQDKLTRISRRTLVLLALVSLAAMTLIYLNGLQFAAVFTNGIGGILLQRLVLMTASGGAAFLLFYYFYHVQREGSRTVRYLINSAIVIYLVHHPLVIMLGWLLDDPALSNTQYYLLLLTLTFLFSYLCYEGVRRVAILRFAFGLKPQQPHHALAS